MKFKSLKFTGKVMLFVSLFVGIALFNSKVQAQNTNTDEPVYSIVEVLPTFPGGEEALRTFIANNLKYPKVAKENNIQGRVFVKFVVKKDGSIGKVVVLRSIHKDLDEEAVRVLSSMPKWTPGKEKNVPVNVSFTIPIDFKLK